MWTLLDPSQLRLSSVSLHATGIFCIGAILERGLAEPNQTIVQLCRAPNIYVNVVSVYFFFSSVSRELVVGMLSVWSSFSRHVTKLAAKINVVGYTTRGRCHQPERCIVLVTVCQQFKINPQNVTQTLKRLGQVEKSFPRVLINPPRSSSLC